MKTKKISGKWKAAAGILLSLLFIFLAFRSADPAEMLRSLGEADYGYLLPVLAVIALGMALRTLRWRLLLAPVREAATGDLFAALSIGYMANAFMPAHLGEFVRAWDAGRRTGASTGSIFATIIVERLIDMASLLLLLGVVLLSFPFPAWVRRGGAGMLAVVVFFGLLLWLMKQHREKAQAVACRLLRCLPEAIAAGAGKVLDQFLGGIVHLKRRGHYLAVAFYSLLIWCTYALTFQLLFHAFNFVALYRLPWTACLVVMVITTISVVVPSSPGYVGSFHLLCQLSLGFFQVPKGPALSYAFILHAVSVYPVFFLGLFFLSREKLRLRALRKEDVHALDR